MPKSIKISLLAASVALVLGIFLGVNAHGVHANTDNSATEGAYRQINVYQEVLQHVQSDYVVTPNMSKVTDGALRGLLESLDAESSYLTPKEYQDYQQDKGGKAQVGVNVSKRFGYATIVSLVPGGPADKANLEDGDIIEAVAGQDTHDLSLAMIQRMLEGAPGSNLEIAVIRPRRADPEKMTLTRAVVAEPAVAQTIYEGGSIVYLKPATLDHDHVQEIESKLKTANKGGDKKVLLDLRDVSTGDMHEALRLANLFVKQGVLATLEGQKFPRQTFNADSAKAVDATAPVVVLVNRGTAGPAELVAAALADNKRASLVGEKTFGAGAEHKTFPLPDGGALILSIAKYASPLGKKFEDDAVTPKTLVASNEDTADQGDDATANKTTAMASKPVITKKAAPAPDDQLNKALEMLKAMTA
ncbi:MAG: S41 family peptidase [Acidobacteriota bacterium]